MIRTYYRSLGLILVLIIFISTVLLAGCSSENHKIMKYHDLVQALSKEGYKTNDMMESTDEDIFVSLLSVKPKKLFVYYEDSRELINVYEYDNKQAADTEAKTISGDGKKIGSFFDGGQNHFFKQGNIIVQYSGSNKSILGILKKSMYKLTQA